MGNGASWGKTKVFQKTADLWKNSKEQYSDDRLKAHIKEVYSTLDAICNSPFPEKVKKQRIESERLVASGSFVILCRILTSLLQTERQSDSNGGTQGGEDKGELLNHTLWSVAIASENCDQVCKAVLENLHLITALVSRLESMFQLESSDEKTLKVRTRHWLRHWKRHWLRHWIHHWLCHWLIVISLCIFKALKLYQFRAKITFPII